MKSYKKKYNLKIKRIYIELYPPDEDIKNKLISVENPTTSKLTAFKQWKMLNEFSTDIR